MKLIFTFFSLIILFGPIAGTVQAKPDFRTAEVGNPQTGNNVRTVEVPQTAVQVSPALYDLGLALDRDGREVQGFLIIHPKDRADHKPNHGKGNGSGGNTGPTTSKCYAHLARGAKWKSVEDYLVDGANTEGLSSAFIKNTVAEDIALWEDAATGAVDGNSVNIFGGEVTGVVDGADTASPDGKNEVLFGNVSSNGAIAVTIVWGIFAGPPSQRTLVEWDQVYDQVDFDWSSSAEPGKMDFDNIAMHELGHSFGLDHPDDSCTQETMYRFAATGETKKQTLEAGDIAGISDLY